MSTSSTSRPARSSIRGQGAGLRDATVRWSVRAQQPRRPVPARAACARSRRRGGRRLRSVSADARRAVGVHRRRRSSTAAARSRCSCCGCRPDAIDRVMTGGQQWERDGLGKTGEAYLVGPDFLMRSNSRFLIEAPEAYAEQSAQDQDAGGRDRSDPARQLDDSESEGAQLRRGTGARGERGHRRAPSVIAASRCWRRGRRCTSPVSSGASSRRSTATKRIMPMQHIARDTLIQTLVILLVITLVVMFLATSFVRPVNDLIARVQLARTGKTDMTFAAEIDRRNRRPGAIVPRADRQRAEADAPARRSDQRESAAARKRHAEGHGAARPHSARARSPNGSKTSPSCSRN